MTDSTTRRDFLARTGLFAAGALAAGAALPGTARAIAPIARPGKPKFKFSLAAYSYRELLTKSEFTLQDFVADCAKFGLEGTELTSYYFPKDVTTAYLNDIKGQCFRLGLDISGTAVGNNLCLPKGEKRDEQIQLVKRWVDHADVLGAPTIRIFSGNKGKDQTEAEAHQLAVEGMEECCEYAGKHGVTLALENHGGLTATAEGLLKLVNDVKSPWFGVNVDTGNFHTADPYGDLAKIAPYAVNVQIKVVIAKEGGSKEPADFKRFAKMMADVGYRGYIVLEYEEKTDPPTECPKFIDQLREAFLAVS
ncbi:MAG: sugar phosphate isomerase/epimerase [Planctomycetaceae bacterium]|nr:sugar phosphate isomerase/epimerase [Planctomycetaceae bacterium]